jgi:NDP-sugar pyrophosphorylase family protein
VDVVILAAGKGERLMPLTADKPKAMVEVNGKPIIYWILTTLKKLDINDIYIISGYKEGTLKSYVKFNFDKNVKFIHQRDRTGTADAVYLARDYIKDNFLVLAGDTIFDLESLKKLIAIPNSLLYTEQNERLYEFGTLLLKHNKIIKISEKSSNPVSNLVNCSAYHFTTNVFRYIKNTLIDERFSERIITNTVNLMMEDDVEFMGIYMKYLNEISYQEDIEKVEARLNE